MMEIQTRAMAEPLKTTKNFSVTFWSSVQRSDPHVSMSFFMPTSRSGAKPRLRVRFENSSEVRALAFKLLEKADAWDGRKSETVTLAEFEKVREDVLHSVAMATDNLMRNVRQDFGLPAEEEQDEEER